MKALTIHQPSASLVMVGAKPFEFRRWSYLDRPGGPALLDTLIVIHAASRPVRDGEIAELLRKLAIAERRGADRCPQTSLKIDVARELLMRVSAAHSLQPVLPLRCGLGTAVLGRPRLVQQVRLIPVMYAWPLSDIEPFPSPIPARGQQGFWYFDRGAEAA